MPKSRTTPIRGDADVARAVAMTTAVARAARLDERRVSAVATAASELSRNIVKYAGRGQFRVTTVSDGEARGIRIEARDRGPGILDTDSALRDHYSTGGTLGLGLPGVRRLMDELTVDSTPGVGTTVTATIWAGRSGDPQHRRQARVRASRSLFTRSLSLPEGPAGRDTVVGAARIRPHRAERVSGDAVVLRWVGDTALAVLVDALGHGPGAAEIANGAAAALRDAEPASAVETLAIIHDALRQTDGAAAAAVLVDPHDRTYRAAAVGNVRVRILGSMDRRLEWVEGTLGAQYRQPQERSGRLGTDVLVIYSDGISDRFEPGDDLVVAGAHPATIARSIVERFGKDHDDAACVALRCER